MKIRESIEQVLRSFYYELSPPMRRRARRLVFWPLDSWERLRGSRSSVIPSRGKVFIGSGDFIVRGQEQLFFLKEYAHLLPYHSVLDVGSGIGRTAVALTGYLTASAKYEGFDVVKDGIDWCNNNISSKYSNFRFTHTEVINDLYNLSGTPATSFRFPYPDDTFDVVFLFSVFTHMGKSEVEHYLREIHRVLKSGGRCLGTYFIYTTDIEESIANRNSSFSFPIKREGHRLMDEKVESANVAFPTEGLQSMVHSAGLRWEAKYDGYWKDQGFKRTGHDFQDIVVLSKD